LKLRIFILFLFLPILSVQAGIIDSLMIHPRDSIGLTSDSLVLRYLQESGIPISDNNKVKLLKSGREKFIDLFEAIREAKHHVHLEYFNFRNDSIANALFALLAEKVKEGVEVRAMFDAFGNWSNNKPLKKKHLKKIREQGIEIVKFDPFTFPYINHAAHRDHRKIGVGFGSHIIYFCQAKFVSERKSLLINTCSSYNINVFLLFTTLQSCFE
jgi:cardiolipin synthase A/B